MSVVITCFNYGRFVGQAIESVQAQTYKPVEITVVDDGSTDDSLDVARRYPVRVLTQANQGVCVATNRGIAAATGAYVMRLDADDVLLPAYVETMVSVLDGRPDVHFAYAYGEYFGARQGLFRLEPFDPEALAQGAYVTTTALFRRDALLAVGGYDVRMTPFRCEDWDLWLAFAERGMRGEVVPEVLWRYRQHGPSRIKWNLRSARAVRREYLQIARLQDNHPTLFAPWALARRLAGLPRALVMGRMTLRHAALLVGFYAVMFARLPHKRLARSGV